MIASVLTLARFSEAFLVLRAPGCRARHARRAMGDGGDDRRLRCARATRRTARRPRPAKALLSGRSQRRWSQATSCWHSRRTRAGVLVGAGCGACTWRSRKDCSRRSSRRPRPPTCAARLSASSGSPAALRCSSRVRSPGTFGKRSARRRHSSRAPRLPALRGGAALPLRHVPHAARAQASKVNVPNYARLPSAAPSGVSFCSGCRLESRDAVRSGIGRSPRPPKYARNRMNDQSHSRRRTCHPRPPARRSRSTCAMRLRCGSCTGSTSSR